MVSSNNKTGSDLLKTLSSLQFCLVILIAVAIVAMIGTLIPQGQSIDFYRAHYGKIVFSLISLFRFDRTYSSPLFIGLLGLFGLNLVLCSLVKFPRLTASIFRPDLTPDIGKIRSMPVHLSIENRSLDEIHKAFSESGFSLRRIGEHLLFGEKRRIGYLGASIVHVSLLVLLTGSIISLVTGIRGHIVLMKGESASTVTLPNGEEIPLGFTLKLDRFDVSFYESHPGRPRSFTSSVTVTKDDGSVFRRDISVNHPLFLNRFNIYQSSYGDIDTALVAVSLKGAPETAPPVATFNMVFGTDYTVPGFGDSITVRLSELYRDFRNGDLLAGTVNPVVRVDVLIHDEIRWSVFMFKNFPGLNMPIHEDIEFIFTLIDIMPGEHDHYTVLGITRDRGIPVMAVGAILMIAGLFISFYIRPRRIWVLKEKDEILIGARTRGDHESLRAFIMKTLTCSGSVNKNGDAA